MSSSGLVLQANAARERAEHAQLLAGRVGGRVVGVALVGEVGDRTVNLELTSELVRRAEIEHRERRDFDCMIYVEIHGIVPASAQVVVPLGRGLPTQAEQSEEQRNRAKLCVNRVARR